MTRSRQALLIICSAGLTLQSAPSLATLVIQIESPSNEYVDPANFEFAVIIRNDGNTPVILLPQRIHRSYTPLGRGAAKYLPHPGPPIKPWKDAFLLEPGQSRTINFYGMRDGDGVWALEYGSYELRVQFSVTIDAVMASQARVKHLGAAIWQGDIQSSNIQVTFSPVP